MRIHSPPIELIPGPAVAGKGCRRQRQQGRRGPPPASSGQSPPSSSLRRRRAKPFWVGGRSAMGGDRIAPRGWDQLPSWSAPGGARTIPIAKFFLGVTDSLTGENVL